MLGVTGSMSSLGSSLLNALKVSNGALAAAFMTPVRYRYYEDKPRLLKRRWGYEDKLDFRGVLPRVPSSRKLPIPEYFPKNPWSQKAALQGQNDYIDILGEDETINPVRFAYGVPSWLRGFHGKEYHMLLRRRAFFGRDTSGIGSFNINKRLKFLYRRMNYKTKSFMDPKVLRR